MTTPDTPTIGALAGWFGSNRTLAPRVVVRYGDHSLIRELYPPPAWRWVELTGRTAGNNAKAEVLIVNEPEGGE